MREIKLRAWDAKQSVMVYDGTMWLPHERWEHRNKYRLIGVSVTSKGILWVRALKDCGPTVTVEMEGKTQHFYSDWDIQYIEKDVELMQWTGLHDKNGVEIYEGDIVRAQMTSGVGGLGEWIGSVDFHDFEYCIETTDLKWPLASWKCVLKAEVIGNIYENPELLSDKR